MRIGFETYAQDYSDQVLLKGLPNDQCQCPHYGYLFSGKMTVTYSDHTDVIHAGEMYYMPPGHSILAEAGAVLMELSPISEWNALMEFARQKGAESS